MTDGFYPVVNHIIHAADGTFYGLCDEGLFRMDHEKSAGLRQGGVHWTKIALTNGIGADVGRNIVQGVEWRRHLILVCQPYPFTVSSLPSLIIYNLDTHRCIIPSNTHSYSFAASTPAGDLLITTDEGVRKLDKLALSNQLFHLLPPPYPYEAAASIHTDYLYFDNESSLWLVPPRNVVRIGKDGSQQQFSEAGGLPAGQTTAILEDRENNMWFTNEQNGISKLVTRHVQYYPQPAAGFTVTDISARSCSDSVWFYDAGKRNILLMTSHTKKLYHAAGFVPLAGHLLVGPRCAWLVGAREIYSLRLLPGQRFQTVLLFQDSSVIDGNACFDPDGNLILSSSKLTIVSNETIEQYPAPGYVDQAAVDGYHRLWTITRGHELSVYKIVDSAGAPRLRLLKKFDRELPDMSPRSLAVDGKGRIWIGSRDYGLFCFFFDDLRLLAYKQITIASGLSENFVNYLLCDPDNTIWACTPTGLNRIRFNAGHFTIEDVVHCNDSYQHIDKVLSSIGGTHWTLTREGFMRFDSSVEHNSSFQPPVLFSKVLADDKPVTHPDGESLNLPYDRNTLSFFIGTPAFTEEGRTRYTWLLEGSRNPEWSNPSTQSAINFVNLPPGSYVLRVRAQFPTGRYPEQRASYGFLIQPPWWQTWWFRSALVLILSTLIMLTVRNYIRRRLERQRIALEKKQAIEKERTRIATDMHDDLGAGLSRIKFLSETIGIKKQQHLPIEEEITSIREYSHEMIDKMGEIVWALNEKNDSLSDLLAYTRSYAAQYLLQAGILVTVETPENFPVLFVSGEFRRNIFLTIKETLHNIVKHAQAGQVWLTMDVGRQLTITIQDDGVGFDRGQVRPYSNGLTNMHHRIRDIGGSLVIQPRDNGDSGAQRPGGCKGTLIRIIAPL
jgi:signal transduction histidine kinase